MFREVPMLPVVVPMTAVVFAILVGDLRRRGRLSPPRAAVALVLCAYAGGVIANTVFPIFLDAPASDMPLKVYVEPVIDYDVADALTNIAVFVPLGFLLPLLMAKAMWWRVVIVASAISCLIELAQLVGGRYTGGGHVADVNDLMFNVLGAVLGFMLFRVFSLMAGAEEVVDRFRWH